ncbi:MAG: response regulator transcription factor [Planctomycetota bacterium]
MNKLRILLADDHQIVREGLRALIESIPGLVIVAEASDGRAAADLAAQHTPDLVILDVGMPVLNGIDATPQILAAAPHAKIIALSMLADRRFVRRMFQAGASAYLLKECAFDELRRALDCVCRGQTYISPGIGQAVVEDYVQDDRSAHGSEAFAKLTAREREVLQLVAEGRTTKQIAADLFVSVKTIETHRQHIMQKLGTTSVAQLTKFAIREGLTQLDL